MSRKTFQEQYETYFPKFLRHCAKYPYSVRSAEELKERLKIIPKNSRRVIEVRWRISKESNLFDVIDICKMLQVPYECAREDFINSKYLLYFIEPENVPFETAVKLGKMVYACYRSKEVAFDMDLYHKIDFYELLDYVYKIDLRYRYIIIKHYGLDGNEPLTFEELSKELETSVNNIKYLEKRAFNVMRLICPKYSTIEDEYFCELAELVFYGKLTQSAYNVLRCNGVRTIQKMKKCSMSQLLALDGIGYKLCREILKAQKKI